VVRSGRRDDEFAVGRIVRLILLKHVDRLVSDQLRAGSRLRLVAPCAEDDVVADRVGARTKQLRRLQPRVFPRNTGRDAAFWGGAEIVWKDGALDDACRSWALAAVDTAAPHASVGRYVNDVTEVGRDVARMIYGDAKYERPVALKREWDLDNVVRLNQNIRPSRDTKQPAD
jgi:hypothetical protein